jgi:hypothetical protein
MSVVTQRGSNLLNAEVETVLEIDKGPVFPDSLLQLLTGDRLSRVRG